MLVSQISHKSIMLSVVRLIAVAPYVYTVNSMNALGWKQAYRKNVPLTVPGPPSDNISKLILLCRPFSHKNKLECLSFAIIYSLVYLQVKPGANVIKILR